MKDPLVTSIVKRAEEIIMSKTLLQQLYDGEIYPGEAIWCKNHEYRELAQKIDNETEYFRKILSPEDWNRFENLYDMVTDKMSPYSYENFLYGFRLGVGMMVETFAVRNENWDNE